MSKNFVGREGFEPSNSEEDRFTVCCRWPLGYLPLGMTGAAPLLRSHTKNRQEKTLFPVNQSRADGGIRTPDLLITNQ